MEKPVGKKITSVNPLEGTMSFLGELTENLSFGRVNPGRATAMTDEVGDITVDTCFCGDTGSWETGIKRESIEGKWVIVSQYESEEEAAEGHKKWTEYMKEEPDCELRDIDMWNLGLNKGAEEE